MPVLKGSSGIAERINSLELVRAAGLSGTKVLSRWHKAGLLPRPRIEAHPGGRGTVATWPSWVLERCMTLAALEVSGFRIPDMLAELKAEAARAYRALCHEGSSEKAVAKLDEQYGSLIAEGRKWS